MSGVLVLILSLILLILSSNIGIASADEELVALRGEDVTISVILLQNGTYGNPVTEQRIEFFDQTNNLLLGIDFTDSSGFASIIWNVPIAYSLGPIIINATFRGNESLFLSPSYQSITLNILSSTEIIVHDTPVLLAPGDMLSFSVTLIDDFSNPLSNRPLLVFSDDILLASSVTNSTGGASFSINCNNSWSTLGENTIQVVHEQDILDYYGRAQALFNVEIQKLVTSIQTNFSLEFVPLGDSFSLEVELCSIEGGISSNLVVLFDGHPTTTLSTDLSGNGTLNLDIDEQVSLGHHHLSIIYNGTERYTGTSLDLEFDVLSPAFIEIIVPFFTVIGSNTDITISLYDILGRPIEGTLSISDFSNGKNMSIQIPRETTHFIIEFPIFSPVGLHSLLMRIGNSFVTNNSIIHTITVWSQPEIILKQSNILHYASLSQELTFITQLTDWSGNISYQSIHLLCNNVIVESSTTDEYGIAVLSALAPNREGNYNFSIFYPMNTTRYEFSAKLDYYLTVSTYIPVLVELDYYEIIPPLQQISIFLRVQCLNGSLLEGILIRIIWESIDSYAITEQGGISQIHLPIPNTSGNYTLYYEVEQNLKLAASSGTINISISLIDILSSQGIGINGFVFGILSSFTIVAIPLVRRRYLLI